MAESAAQDVKWQRALLKKWRLVVGLKERQAAGHTLTTEQLEKIAKSDELRAQLKKAGVQEDAARNAEKVGVKEVFDAATRKKEANAKPR